MVSRNKLAKVEEAGVPELHDWDDSAGQGFEDTGTDDFSRPYVYLLQSNSGVVMEGLAAAGGIRITGMELILTEAMRFIPVYSKKEFVQWHPMDAGGGYVRAWDVNDPDVLKIIEGQPFGKYKVPTDGVDDDLVETYYLFMLLVTDSGLVPAIMPITGTKITPYKRFLTAMRMHLTGARKPYPMRAHRCQLGTKFTQNKKGRFYIPEFSFVGGSPAASVIEKGSDEDEAGATYYGLIVEGSVDVDREKSRTEEDVAGDDIPF